MSDPPDNPSKDPDKGHPYPDGVGDSPDNSSNDVDKGHSYPDGVGDIHDTASVPSEHGTTPPASDDGGHSRPRTPLTRFRSYGSSQFRTPQRDRTLIPKDTPIAFSNNSMAHSSDDTDSESVHRRHAENAKKWIVGPMPVEQFLSTFLPESELPDTDDGLSMPDPTGAFDAVPSEPAQESHLYKPLITAINTPQRCPSVKFCDTSNNSLETGKGSLKPDICAYYPDELFAVKKGDKVTAELGHAEIFAEVKITKDKDPFVDPPIDLCDPAAISKHEFLKIGEYDISRNTDRANTPKYRDARKSLGQNVSYAIAACARQHRIFYFSIFIIGTCARLIRWDRSGAIVTRAFDYKLQPEFLCKFLWRFGLATPSQRGYDPSVVKVTDAEDDLYKHAIRNEVAFQLDLDAERDAVKLDEAVRRHYSNGRVTKMEVYDRRRDVIHQFLISRPVQSPLSMAGRSTRGQWAVKVNGGDAKKVFFIKDTWRVIADRMDPEGDAYDDINEHDVTNVGTMYCEGDIPIYVEDAPDRFDMGESQDEMFETQETPDTAQPDVGIEDHIAKSQAGLQIDLPDSQTETVTSTEENTSEPAVQSTRTHEFVNANWSCRGGRRVRVFKRVHYRLVLEEVGYPLSELTGTRELFEATHDALLAIIDAKRKCRRLHRDISIDNILLVRKRGAIRRQGILIDWELSTLIDRDGMARDYDRSGTWAFMSLALLSNTGGFRHSIADDMESLLYVVLFCCARWIPHNDVNKLGPLILKFFFQADQDAGDDEGGAYKALQRSTRYFTKKFQFSDKTIDKWLFYIYELLSEKARKWEETTVEPLWRQMRNCNLSDGDRYEHYVGDVFGERPSFFATRTTHTVESVSSKRPAETNLDVPERSSKRRRCDSGEGNEPVDGGADSGQG